jgi:soluble lytic murein transglycosylase-like protein
MSETGIFDNIRNVLNRIDEIKRTFGGKGAQIRGEFENRLNEKLATAYGRQAVGGPARVSGASGEVKAAGDAGVENPGNGSAADTVDGGGSGAVDAVIKTASERFRIPESLIKAVIKQESGFNREAVSHKGAMGLMQLMPDTADALGVGDPFDMQENVFGGTRYLRELINLYGGNLNEALAAYNAGPDRVKEGVPEIPETKDYVKSVLDHYERYSSEGYSTGKFLETSAEGEY